MAAVFRLGSRQFLNQILKNEKSGMLALVRPVTMKPMPAKSIPEIDHDERNMKINRPLSPHITIYAFGMTGTLSITHRITGVALAGYMFLLGGGALVLPETIPHYIEAANFGAATLFVGKSLLAFPMTYHFWNGIRHLSWDMGKFFSMKEIYGTGYVVLALTAASTLMLAGM